MGWNFTAPYGNGGSSRHLTIAAVCHSPAAKHLPKRLVKDLYVKFGWSTANEKKWADMGSDERTEFATATKKLCEKHTDVKLHAIVVNKEKVENHIRQDPNKLYNYMIGLMLLDEMSLHDLVTFVPDPRTVKVASGNSLHDYLQTKLWFDKKTKTILRTHPIDSKQNRSLQFVDMLAGLVQSRFENTHKANFEILIPVMKVKALFF